MITIEKGQVYKTKMISSFTGDGMVLPRIKILTFIEGFVIFTREGHKQVITKKTFISTFIKACKYKLQCAK